MNADSLRKVIELERKRGCADNAVFGGLDRFLRNWSGEASSAIVSPSLLRRFRKLFEIDYASLSVAQRQGWLQAALAFLGEVENKKERHPRTCEN